ncbi:hypothetical protein TELCIR_05406 [Teladorsagia circumcincta]|uniref:Amino acid transporter transmembrane domain-containing protein n=1 Tax=Teladorsagia circumcincta TaxID=45464 RepID=A0A2G9UQX0_TELCI|nr:hypothetical protein TELCIR_05406 [Teladorsagia circumcincta]
MNLAHKKRLSRTSACEESKSYYILIARLRSRIGKPEIETIREGTKKKTRPESRGIFYLQHNHEVEYEVPQDRASNGTGFALVFFIGLLTCICMAKIVRCSQFLSSRRFVNICLSSLVLGICSVYYIFVVDHAKEILPLENKMKHPSEMLGWVGVLTTGIVLVTTVYAGCGFFGYITYGENVKGSITLNMDQSPLNLGLKALLALVVYTGYLIQLYTLTSSLRPSVMRFIERNPVKDKRKMALIADYGLRVLIVLVSCE